MRADSLPSSTTKVVPGILFSQTDKRRCTPESLEPRGELCLRCIIYIFYLYVYCLYINIPRMFVLCFLLFCFSVFLYFYMVVFLTRSFFAETVPFCSREHRFCSFFLQGRGADVSASHHGGTAQLFPPGARQIRVSFPCNILIYVFFPNFLFFPFAQNRNIPVNRVYAPGSSLPVWTPLHCCLFVIQMLLTDVFKILH